MTPTCATRNLAAKRPGHRRSAEGLGSAGSTGRRTFAAWDAADGRPVSLAQIERRMEYAMLWNGWRRQRRMRERVQSAVYGRGTGADTDGTFQGRANGLCVDRSNWAAGLTVTFRSGTQRRTQMKWVTRSNIKVDRVACPWLIRRFIDPEAEFLFVPEQQLLDTVRKEEAIAFDANRFPEVKLNHRGERCSFEAILEDYKLTDPAL